MKTIFIFIVYIGWGNTQSYSFDHFDTMAACEAARQALIDDATSYVFDGPTAKTTRCKSATYDVSKP